MDDASKVYFFTLRVLPTTSWSKVGSAAQTDIEALTVSASKNLHLKLA